MNPAYEHNGQTVDSAAFYAVACDPRRSVAVEACAGAGKTWMLVSRILRALLEGATLQANGGLRLALAPHEILAISFTKKAAGEMRQRLGQWLLEFAQLADEQRLQVLQQRGLDAQRAAQMQPLLAQLHAAVLASDRPVQIRTFHSWFAQLLRSAPLGVLQQLGLPAHYELLEDDAPAVALVWRRFLGRLLQDDGARADYQWVVAQYGRHQTQKALAAALAKRVEFLHADAHGVVDRSVQSFQQQFAAFAGFESPPQALWQEGATRDAFYQAAAALGRASAASYAAKGQELEMALGTQNLDALVAALLTKDGAARKFSEKLAGLDAIRRAQAMAQDIVAASAQHAAWQYQQRMARLTRVLIDEFAQLKRERAWVDMNDVEQAAVVLLGDAQLSGWIAQRLDARIRHLLIDEFQDTNPLQWQALHAWLSGYAGVGGGARGPSLFIVGDPKQSIYRFRRAEPQVFRAAQAFVREGLGGDLLSCDHTRRNAPAVIERVNAVMSQAQEDGEYDGFRCHSTASQAAGGLQYLPQIARPSEPKATDSLPELVWRDSLHTPRHEAEETLKMRECQQLAAWIAQQLQRGVAPKDIMVLARKRERLSLLQTALRERHIAAQQPEKRDLFAAPEVQDVVALLDVLVSNDNDLALAQALKSPWFGLGDDDLVQLALLAQAAQAANAGGARVSWYAVLQQSAELPRALQGLGPTLARWQTRLAQLPPHDALAEIFHEGDVLARYAASVSASARAGVLANLRGLLAAALQVDASRYVTPYALVRALKAGALREPVSADIDAVQLLTVHGAKGLEAPLVVLLDADAAAPKAQSMGVLVDWPGSAAAPHKFIFLASEAAPPACAAASVQAEQQARAREEINALYVAMTRAQSHLLLSSSQPHRALKRSWWQRLWAHGVPAEVPPDNASLGAPAPTHYCLQVLPSWSPAARAASTHRLATDAPRPGAQPLADSTESRVGQAMHRLLERVSLAQPRVTSSQVGAVALEFALDAAQAETAQRMAQTILSGAAAWAWDASRVDWDANEVTLHWQGNALRVDRLLHRGDTGEWWVLDYKSSHQPETQAELCGQLETYRQAVQACYPGALVRAAFVTASGRLVEPPVA